MTGIFEAVAYGLLPCPFCGGNGDVRSESRINEDPAYFVLCRSCGCKGPWAKVAANAVSQWNFRTDPRSK